MVIFLSINSINKKSLHKFMEKLNVRYSNEEYYSLMRVINAENINKLSRMDLFKLFFFERASENPAEVETNPKILNFSKKPENIALKQIKMKTEKRDIKIKRFLNNI